MNKNAALYALQEREQMEVDLQYHRQNKSFYYNKLSDIKLICTQNDTNDNKNHNANDNFISMEKKVNSIVNDQDK